MHSRFISACFHFITFCSFNGCVIYGAELTGKCLWGLTLGCLGNQLAVCLQGEVRWCEGQGNIFSPKRLCTNLASHGT